MSRATPPPVRPRRHDHDDPHEHRRGYRRQKSNFPLAFGLSVAFAAVTIVALLALLGRQDPPTFNELKAELGIPATGNLPALDLDQVEFVNRLDRIGASREHQLFQDRFLYLYYTVREGQAQIIVDRGAWQGGRARIVQVALR